MRGRSSTKEKEEKGLAEAESEKTTIKCSSFNGLMKKVKALKNVLCRNKNMDAHLMAPKGKAKVHQPPTRFSLRLAALKAHQSRDKAGPSRTVPINAKPIEISSDLESEEVLEYIPGTGQSDDEEPAENQNPGEEEPGEDHEIDPNPDPEEPEEDLEEEEDPEEEDPEELEEQEEENEMGKEQVEAVEPSDDEYQEYFADYFELTPPASPDSSNDSTPPADD
ncbi:hypothetical protein PIB30_065228 [Stylosanthes scabra]|uniref:Uncharacterized protein n=1 Tax=Stylosanthes scabra TaxID=79078 RepID=A0ABU6WLJ1_9FABA|nr:hypothetical protein [Stylosanthes scabra]